MPDPHDTSQTELTAAFPDAVLLHEWATTLRSMASNMQFARHGLPCLPDIAGRCRAIALYLDALAARSAVERTGEGSGDVFSPYNACCYRETCRAALSTPPSATEGLDAAVIEAAIAVANGLTCEEATGFYPDNSGQEMCARRLKDSVAALAAGRQASAESGAGGVG